MGILPGTEDWKRLEDKELEREKEFQTRNIFSPGEMYDWDGDIFVVLWHELLDPQKDGNYHDFPSTNVVVLITYSATAQIDRLKGTFLMRDLDEHYLKKVF